jgi:hypothetical protein
LIGAVDSLSGRRGRLALWPAQSTHSLAGAVDSLSGRRGRLALWPAQSTHSLAGAVDSLSGRRGRLALWPAHSTHTLAGAVDYSLAGAVDSLSGWRSRLTLWPTQSTHSLTRCPSRPLPLWLNQGAADANRMLESLNTMRPPPSPAKKMGKDTRAPPVAPWLRGEISDRRPGSLNEARGNSRGSSRGRRGRVYHGRGRSDRGWGGGELAQREKMVTRPMRSERSKQFDWDVIEVFLYCTCFGTAASATPLMVFSHKKKRFSSKKSIFFPQQKYSCTFLARG